MDRSPIATDDFTVPFIEGPEVWVLGATAQFDFCVNFGKSATMKMYVYSSEY